MNTLFAGYFALYVTILCFAASSLAQDDISIREGRYEVFYSAFNSSFLKPEVAKAVDIVRAKNRAVLNISVVEHLDNGELRPVMANEIEGTTFNLIHRNTLEFQEVVEPGARYYLAPFKINNDNEMIQIEVQLTPKGSNRPMTVKFKRHFYQD